VLGKAAGRDAQRAELSAGRLVAGAATLACAARDVMHDRDARAVLEPAFHLVTEHRPARGCADLLDVGAAQAARLDTHEETRPRRDGNISELGQPVGV